MAGLDFACLWIQEELIKSEEERLAISQALLTMQMDLNHAQVNTIKKSAKK